MNTERPSNLWIFISFLILISSLIISHYTHDIYGVIKIVTMHTGILLLAVVWIINMLKTQQKRITLSSALFCFSLFIVYSAASILYAANMFEAVYHFSFWLFFLLLIFVIQTTITTTSGVIRILRVIFLTALIAVGYSIAENKGINVRALRTSYVGTFGHPTFFAEYLMPAVMIGVLLYVVDAGRKRKPFYFATTSFMLFYLLLTKSRGAFVGLLCGCIVAVFISRKKITSFFTKKRVIYFIVISCVILFLLMLFMPVGLKSNIYIKFQKILNPAEGRYELFTNHTIIMRLIVWRNTLNMVVQHPLFGVGIGNFRTMYPLFRSGKDWDIFPRGIRFSKVHNEMLQFFAEGGIIGGGLFICFLILLFCLIYRNIRQTQEGKNKKLLYGLACTMIAMLGNGLFSSNLRIPASALIFWVIYALIEGLIDNKDKPFKIPTWVLIPVIAGAAFLGFHDVQTLRASIAHKKAIYFDQQKRLTDEIAYLNKSVDLVPYASTRWFELGTVYQELGMANQALDAYLQGLEYDPYNILFLNNVGTVYYRLEQFDDAVKMFKRVVEIDPYYAGAYYNLIATYKALGLNAEMAEAENKLFELEPLFYANRLIAEKKYKEAYAQLEKAREKQQEDPVVYKKLALVLFELGDYAKGMEIIDHAIKLDPHDYENYYIAGYFAYQHNEWGNVVEYYKDALNQLEFEKKKHISLIEFYSMQGFLKHVISETEEIDKLKQREFEIRQTICKIYIDEQLGDITEQFVLLVQLGIYDEAVFRYIIGKTFEFCEYSKVRYFIEVMKKANLSEDSLWDELLQKSVQIIAFYNEANKAEADKQYAQALGYYKKIVALNSEDNKAFGSIRRLSLDLNKK